MFVYETSRVSVRTGQPDGGFDPSRCNAVRCYMRHYQNFLFLDFMSANGTMTERHQANEEIKICKNKMRFWERQPHFDHDQMIAQKDAMHKGRAQSAT